MSPFLEFGYVARAHGMRGEVGVRLHDDQSSVLSVIKRAWVRPRVGEERVLWIAATRNGTKNDVLVTFAEISGRDAAEALTGAKLSAFREDLPPCEAGEVFQGDLVGLEAVGPDGEILGRIEGFFEGGPVPNLVIQGGPRGEMMVPFAEEFIVEIDLKGGRVVVRPLEFLP